jgi:hypothetical protein
MAGAKGVSVKMARAIAAEINGLDRLFVDMETYIPLVRDEIASLMLMRGKDTRRHAVRSLLFALASPQNRFDANVIVARKLHDRLSELESTDQIVKLLMEDKLGTVTSGAVGRAIFHNLDFIRNVKSFSGKSLRDAQRNGTITGAGMKVTAMAAHLNDPWDDVFTLDTHMLRGIIDTVLGIRDTWTIQGTAYGILETALLDWAKSRYPRELPFTIQWAMWAVFRGTFDSHIAIFN